MLDISCSPNKHCHYWVDPVSGDETVIPESFLDEVRVQLELPLQELRGAVLQALAEIERGTLAFRILQEALTPPDDEEDSDD